MEPRTIGGYELRDVLGEGGMGTVYRAHDPTLDRPAAVKVIRAKALSADGKERFLREARACSRINHPNVITVYAAGEENGEPYMAMELIDGRTLRDLIDNGSIDWRQAARWVVDLLDALQRLHAEGIVHRDLKPENIMVTREGVIKLMDFGLAHLASSATLTREGTTVGTVPYMSPEQVLGKKVDARSDLFSIATIFHEMITGSHPFRGEHPMAVMYSIRNETPKPLKLQSGDFPIRFQQVLDRAFAKEVDKRYPNAGAFRDAILEVVPDLAGGGTVDKSVSARRMALLVGVVSTVSVGLGLTVWNVVQGRRAHANRTAAVNLNQMGSASQDAGDLSKAESQFREAIAKDPAYAVPYNNLGALALRAGEKPEADSLFRLAVSRNPRYSAALVNIGNLFLDVAEATGYAGTEADSAEAYFRRALDGDQPALGANQLGALLIARGRPEEARRIVGAAVADSASVAPAMRGYLLRTLGKAAAAMGDSTAAMALWKEALSLLPGDRELQHLTGAP
jgi:Tfp pilus assembly protein PilF/predicted Ser/Thr protein kinase